MDHNDTRAGMVNPSILEDEEISCEVAGTLAGGDS